VDADKHLLGMIQKACQYALALSLSLTHAPTCIVTHRLRTREEQPRRPALWTTPHS
jgi:hypothetical protein